MSKFLFLAAALAFLFSSTAMADNNPYGVWRRPEDGSTYLIYRCGRDGLCAKLKTVRDGPESLLVGSVVFASDGRAGSRSWTGKLRNPHDGAVFASKITQMDDSVLQLDGCLPQNDSCVTENWRRAY